MLEKIYHWIGVAFLVLLGLAALPIAVLFIVQAAAAIIALLLILAFLDTFYG